MVSSRRAVAVCRAMPITCMLVAGAFMGLVAVPGAMAEHETSPLFVDATADAGIGFLHAGNRFHLPLFPDSTMGGACTADFDVDGDLDLFIVDGYGPDDSGRSRLYLQDKPSPGGVPVFLDATGPVEAGLTGHGQGCVVGDYDNDGDPDLFVTFAVTEYATQTSTLLRNRFVEDEEIRFDDVTIAAGVTGDSVDVAGEFACLPVLERDGKQQNACFSTGAAWLDFDLDGDLDLYVGNYAEYPVGTCQDKPAADPERCTGQYNRLYRNDGLHPETDGVWTFTEIAEEAGVHQNSAPSRGHSLGVVAADIDRDGWPDVYVANDMDPNALYLNQGDGTFVDVAAIGGVTGAGADPNGETGERAGMGVDVSDLNDDGHADLLSTHLRGQYDAVYLGQGDGTWSPLHGVEPALDEVARMESRWGGGFHDLDMDGRKDILIAAGSHRTVEGGPVALLFQRADGGFERPSEGAWPYQVEDAETMRNYRGALFWDVDNDGDRDLFLTALETAAGPGAPLLLLNDAITNGTSVEGHRWLRITLIGTDHARDAIGAWIEVQTDDGRVMFDTRRSGGSYLNDNDPRLLFALGTSTMGVVTVHWPGGDRSEHAFDLDGRRGLHLTLVEPDTLAPRPVRLRGEPWLDGQTLHVAWTASMVPDFASYEVHLDVAGRSHKGATVKERNVLSMTFEVPRGTGLADVAVRVDVVDQGGNVGRVDDDVLSSPSSIVPAILLALSLALWAHRRR